MPSPTFLSIPKQMLVTMSTTVNGEMQEPQKYRLRVSEGDQDEIRLDIFKGIMSSLSFKLRPIHTPSGTLTMATPHHVFVIGVSAYAPCRVHIHRDFTNSLDGERTQMVTCLIPIRNVPGMNVAETYFASQMSMRDDVDSDKDRETALHYGELMQNFHVFVLDTFNEHLDYCTVYTDFDTLLYDFTTG